jgi:hypothetical protein
MGADETQNEASFQAAIRIAKEQKSVSLEQRAEVARSRSLRNARSKLDKQRLAFVAVLDDFFWRGGGVVRSKSPAAFTSRHRITAPFSLT